MVLAIYEVFGTRTLGSKVSPIGRVYGAKDAVDAIMEGIAYYSDKFKGDVKITELRVWGTDKGISKLDPNTLCDSHISGKHLNLTI